jgi:hypothetical protein
MTEPQRIGVLDVVDHRGPSAQRQDSSRLANRLDDTLHDTAGNRGADPVAFAIGERSKWLTDFYVDGGASVHLLAEVRRRAGLGACSARSPPVPPRRSRSSPLRCSRSSPAAAAARAP